jgi:methyl-accepting chemotaxis protein
MKKFLWVYFLLNILLGSAAFLLRNDKISLLILLVLMAGGGMVLMLYLDKLSDRIQKNVETITKGQLNLNVRKTKFGMFDTISGKINDFLFKIRGLIASFGDISKRVVRDAREVEKQAETIKLASGEIASTIQSVTESVSNQAVYTRNMMDMIQDFASGARDISENAEISFKVAKETEVTIVDSFERFKDIKQKVQ